MQPRKAPSKSSSAVIHEFPSGIQKLPPVEQIQGVQLQRSAFAAERKVYIEYSDRNNGWHELEMPLSDAMYLLSLLCQIERDAGLPARSEPLPDE